MNSLSIVLRIIFGPRSFNLFLILAVLAVGCKSSQSIPTTQEIESHGGLEPSDTLSQAATPGYDRLVQEKEQAIALYKPAATKLFDILHTELDLAFDYQNQTVTGTAELTIRPFFHPQQELVLDAQDFELGRIYYENGGEPQSTGYRYDGQQVRIYLPEEVTRADTFKLSMKYTAFPERNSGPGSAAISDTKGLYFIDPLDTVPSKPRMIWTQGETDHNSKWFPTLDTPNEKFTQLIKLTVADSLVTIGNGELVRQEELGNGLRKDHWEMNLPHSPYLAAFAIGDFGKVEAEWDGIPLGYYVEKGFEKGAERVFKNTPEMMGFFSGKLGVRYPWPKYDQIVVRDFVSGAMENTTASIFMEELRLDEHEAIDSEWDYIIAHELFHQWFGDYVSVESWANLTLNEGFANYSEFLWNEYKYGADEAKLKLIAETENYYAEAENKQVDLIRYAYSNAEDLFDSHSYSKGGMIIHMLRTYLGETVFYRALQDYLEKHAFGNVEVNDLRMAFEKISGEDLSWFFNQWFLDKGHPELLFEVDYSIPENILISVTQLQDLNEAPLYQLPIVVSWYEGGERKSKQLFMNQAFQQFALENKTPVDLVFIDEGKNLLAKRIQSSSPEQMRSQFRISELGIARYEALDSLAAWEAHLELESMMLEAVMDEFWAVQENALSILQSHTEWLEASPELEQAVQSIALGAGRNSVRSGALDVLSAFDPDQYQALFLELASDSSYLVAGSALMGLVSAVEPPVDEATIERYSGETNYRMVIPVAEYYISNYISGKGNWFLRQAETIKGEGLYYFLGYLSEYFLRFPEEGEEEAVEFLFQKFQYDSRSYVRLGAFQALLGFTEPAENLARLNRIAGEESDEELASYYNYFLEALNDEN
ncbi:M1 family metallopeptidase [Algoriphagus halophytocola]|uniref:M1 family metallopeptidase n=1 Tax=Algoriphagus halophytocola TaxID=2991499 RepID=UPI0022DE6960|nr:M1 family metallopeptidase [Algoriphagus sp. TR-M9]WBL43357.1 M1 family metallopeptidase [Algoriphagus sp. TR-M9]